MTVTDPTTSQPRVAVVGAGVAGMTAAAELAARGMRVVLFEQRKALGGRASSFYDPRAGIQIDHGHHAVMGCCTNVLDLLHRADVMDCFQRERVLNFVAPGGRVHRFAPGRWLPAPLHLLVGLWRLRLLLPGERLGVMRTMSRLAGRRLSETESRRPIETWLRWQGESDRAIEQFWTPLLVSALSETLDRIAVAAARKVCRDGMLAARDAYELYLPTCSLHAIFHERMGDWLRRLGVEMRLPARVARVQQHPAAQPKRARMRAVGITLANGESLPFDFIILAVPWHSVRGLLPAEMLAWMPELAVIHRYEPAPITAVHLWFDRPITPLPHAVLPGRMSQWLFRLPQSNRSIPAAANGRSLVNNRQSADISPAAPPAHDHYQVLISAAYEAAAMPKERLVERVVGELHELGRDARDAQLQHRRVSTQLRAVFSPAAGLEPYRPGPDTAAENVVLAGDWTATGWPSTLESAVRSGRMAAERVLERLGCSESLLTPDLPRARLTRWLIGP